MLPKLDLSIYEYTLPQERIALFPTEKRDECRLLFTSKVSGEISHHRFKDVVKLIPLNSEIFVNTSKVIAARIPVVKSTGGKAEIFLTDPVSPFSEFNLALHVRNKAEWHCIIGGKNIHAGDKLFSDIPDTPHTIAFDIIQKEDNKATVGFDLTEFNMSVADFLDKFGKIPLPPYIKRETTDADKTNYQTVYAKPQGSVAAPTAGLHFTKTILKKFIAEGIPVNETVLHVGLGTFKPIDTDDINKHDMHAEKIFITDEMISKLIACVGLKKNIVAVGTTTTRTLESAYWLGVRLFENPELKIAADEIVVTPDDPYTERKEVSAFDALNALLKYLKDNSLTTLNVFTRLFIVPGYDYKLVNILITNFHQPGSTLILLVAAFLGRDLWKKAYDAALAIPDYRFLSYGDACLFIRRLL